MFPQPRHELDDVRRLCPGYSIERCWRRSPKHRDKAAAASWIGRPPRRGSWNRAQLHAGVTDRRRFQWMFRSRPLAKPQSEVGWAKLLPECTALAIGLAPCSLTMDAQAETWIEVSGGTARLINAGAVASPTRAEPEPRGHCKEGARAARRLYIGVLTMELALFRFCDSNAINRWRWSQRRRTYRPAYP